MAVAVELLEMCSSAGSEQLRRMKAALAAASTAAGSSGQQPCQPTTAQTRLGGQPASGEEIQAIDKPPAAVHASEAQNGSAEQAGSRQHAGHDGEAAASPADVADVAAVQPPGIAIPSFRAVQQAERQRAAPINLFKPSGGAAGTAAQPETQRPSGAVNPYAFLDSAPRPAGPAATASHFKVPAAASGPAAVGDAPLGGSRRHQPGPAGMASAIPAAPHGAAGHTAGPFGLAAAAAAALASAAEDSMSEDEEDAQQGAGWLGAVMAAQQRVMGSVSAKRRAAGPAGHAVAATRQPAAAQKAAAVSSVQRQPSRHPAGEDGLEALSLGDSEQPAGRGTLGFMGL